MTEMGNFFYNEFEIENIKELMPYANEDYITELSKSILNDFSKPKLLPARMVDFLYFNPLHAKLFISTYRDFDDGSLIILKKLLSLFKREDKKQYKFDDILYRLYNLIIQAENVELEYDFKAEIDDLTPHEESGLFQ